MTKKIFRTVIIAALSAMLICTAVTFGFLYNYFTKLQTRQLWDELAIAASGVEISGSAFLNALPEQNTRLTWIDGDGSVIFDGQTDRDTMENHADREEVREALQGGSGESTRYSNTLLEQTIYCATRLSDGSVLRISINTASIQMLVLRIMQPICIVLVIILIPAFFLAKQLAKRIVQPLNNLDLEHPLENDAYDEIAPLLRRISQQSRQISTQLRELQQKKDEFTQITTNMNEGLVLLDYKGSILSINPAARKLFQADDPAIGEDFLLVERSREISDAITRASQCGHSEVVMNRHGRIYQINTSRIEFDGTGIGVVLLVFDITEKIDAERTRREFTANVSHELKTPLTTIIGSSELLQEGMVKPEDIPHFAAHIHDEAARLLTLIEDIIRLSRLDEGTELPTEPVDLSGIAEDVVNQLREKALQSQILLHMQTEHCILQGVPRLFHEIIYNLVENSIKYNTAGGSVTITVTHDGTLTVADTGIGIPAEHQERVFERFYRVDKSHSKATGGTGLGLSIVKHAAAHLGASLNLHSVVGEGTVITVTFPCDKQSVISNQS